jgi:hypothetical protein
MMRLASKRIFIGVLLVVASGCTEPTGRPPLQAVTGRLTFDGQPVPGIVLTFRPVGSTLGVGGHAFSASDGQFQVHYARGGVMGAAQGEYEISFWPSESAPTLAPEVAKALSRPVTVRVDTPGQPVDVELRSEPAL